MDAIFAKAFETSNELAAQPNSLSCWTVSVTVFGESKNLLVSRIRNFDLISWEVMYFGSSNSGSYVSALSKDSRPDCVGWFISVDFTGTGS